MTIQANFDLVNERSSYDPETTPSAILRRAAGWKSKLNNNTDSLAQVNPQQPWRLSAGFVSVPGGRSKNEDCGYSNTSDGLFLVADGVGGHRGGAEASRLVTNTVPSWLLNSMRRNEGLEETLPNEIGNAVRAAQLGMKEMASRDSKLIEMGSTLAMGLVYGESLYVAHMGDSRVYLVRRGTIKQLTKDHTFVQALIDAGCLTREKAAQHPLRHVITDSVNARILSAAAIQQHQLLTGDRLVFTTDGLTDFVDEDALGWAVARSDNAQETADELVRQALENHTKDNVTCLIVHVEALTE